MVTEDSEDSAPLVPDLIISELRATDKWGAIHEMIEHFRDHAGVEDTAAWEAAIVEREKLCSTQLRPGVALPHARTTAVNHLVWAVGISKDGIAFESPDAPRAHLIILVGIPPFMVRHYLRFVSRLAQWLRSDLAQGIPELAKNENVVAILQSLPAAESAISSTSD